MKKIILFFGSFDPLHKGHISIIENAIRKVDADLVYLGLNKSSTKGKLTSLFHRKRMLSLYCKDNHKCKLLNFNFDYQNIENTYNHIFNLLKDTNQYYILIGQDQFSSLTKWYKYDLLYDRFYFIIAKRETKVSINDSIENPKFIFIDHEHKNISSSSVKRGNYALTKSNISEYIISYNIYLKEQIKKYLSNTRYLHTLSVSKTALSINKKAKLNLDKYKVEKAALLHDIGKNIKDSTAIEIMKEHYQKYLNEDKNLFHQYIGSYLAKEKFYINDKKILDAIKYHTTGRAKMSLLEKLIYVADKVEPHRNYDTSKLINTCIKDFEEGFIEVLNHNKNYLNEKNIKVTNKDNLECFDYYL